MCRHLNPGPVFSTIESDLATFRRALEPSEQIGDHNGAANIALTVFQEMGDHLAVIERGTPISGRSLSEETHSLEHDLIKHALEVSEGSITYAARLLGVDYQALTYMLKTRHKDLLNVRTPVRRRRKPQQ